MRHLSPVIVAGLLLVSCSPAPQVTSPYVEPPSSEKDRQIAEEQQQRERIESRLRTQEARTSAWQLTSALAFGLVSLALIVGIILGSNARHACRQK